MISSPCDVEFQPTIILLLFLLSINQINLFENAKTIVICEKKYHNVVVTKYLDIDIYHGGDGYCNILINNQ